MTVASKSARRARAAVVASPALPAAASLGFRNVTPSRRSLATAAALAALACSAYVFALLTPAFAVERVTVRGAPRPVAADVRRALAPLAGESLLRVDGADLERRVEAVAWVASATYDRAFPHGLAVFVVPERPIAVLRRGAEHWLVSRRGRALERLPRGARPELPRIWARRSVAVAVGATLSDPAADRALTALRALSDEPLPVRVRSVRSAGDELTLQLASGLELILGDVSDLRLKLAIARRIVSIPAVAGASSGYVDLTVPARPVAGDKSQLESRG